MPVESSNFEFLEPPQSDDELGRIGPYRVLNLIGEGGMGAVFRAQDNRLRRDVALKTMRKKWSTSPIGRKRFVEEARSMAAVHHDNVATIFEVGIHEGTPFLAMEMLEGKPLNQLIKENYRFTLDEIFRLASEVASGLSAAHQRGIIHRDIKPANIWIESPSGRAKILDFGLAIVDANVDRFTHRGSVLGSPAYLSPEQSRGEPLDDRTDLYSLGVVLYQVCVGRPPHLCKTIPSQLIANICKTPVSLPQINPDLPSPLTDLIHQLLEKEPKNRPRSASKLITLINQAKEACDHQSSAALQIVTNDAVRTNEYSPTRSIPKSVSEEANSKSGNRKLGIFIAPAIALVATAAFFFFRGPGERIASEPTPVTVKSTQDQPQTIRITPAKLEPLALKFADQKEDAIEIPNAATFNLMIENNADSSKLDPKRIFSSSKVVTQVMTYLNPVGSNEVTRPAFAVKFSPTRLPTRGKVENFTIQFLTDELDAKSYKVTFELQTPSGESVQRIETQITLKQASENKQSD